MRKAKTYVKANGENTSGTHDESPHAENTSGGHHGDSSCGPIVFSPLALTDVSSFGPYCTICFWPILYFGRVFYQRPCIFL